MINAKEAKDAIKEDRDRSSCDLPTTSQRRQHLCWVLRRGVSIRKDPEAQKALVSSGAMRLTRKVGGGRELAVKGADPRKQSVMELMRCLGQACVFR